MDCLFLSKNPISHQAKEIYRFENQPPAHVRLPFEDSLKFRDDRDFRYRLFCALFSRREETEARGGSLILHS